MLKSFLLITLRNIANNKGAAWLNILCLTLGVATCLFIFNYITFELSFDRHFRNGSVFRVERMISGENGVSYQDAYCDIRTGPALRQQYPFIKHFTRLVPFSEEGVAHFRYQRSDTVEQRVYLQKVYYAESSITSILPVTFVVGDKATALAEPNSLALSRSSARQIFGEEIENGNSVLGKEFTVSRQGIFKEKYIVTGVFEDLPVTTHLQFDALVGGPMFRSGEGDDIQIAGKAYTYVSIKPDKSPGETLEYKAGGGDATARLYLRPVEDVHLSPSVSNNPEAATDRSLLLFLALIGLIVMLLAISNYTNNTILNSVDRAKEIGLRKLMGIKPVQLISTFVGEAFFVNGVAGVFAVIFFRMGVNMALKYGKSDVTSGIINPIDFESIIEQNMATNALFLTCLLLISTLLSSLYPAFYFNSLNPVALLRGKLQLASSRVVGGASRMVRSLLVFQVTISVLFLSGVYIVFAQLRHMEEHEKRPAELNVKGIFPGSAMASPLFTANALDRIDELMRAGFIRHVEFSNLYEGQIKTSGEVAVTGLGGQPVDTLRGNPLFVVDHSYWPETKSPFVAGRNFSKSYGHDNRKMVLNVAAMQKLGIEHPDSLPGKSLKTAAGSFEIIGVVEDPSPQARFYVTGFGYRTYFNFILQYPGKAGESVHDFLEKLEVTLSSPLPFFSLLRRDYQNQRLVETSILRMFLFFTAMAIVIANIGMFGLSSFITQKRTKEIGLRKILGATTLDALWVLVFDFLKLALAGSVIAMPIVLWGGNWWLEDYESRISVGPGMVAVPVLLILFISLIVVAGKCWKAAASSPLKALE